METTFSYNKLFQTFRENVNSLIYEELGVNIGIHSSLVKSMNKKKLGSLLKYQFLIESE